MSDFSYVTSKLGAVESKTLEIAREVFNAAAAAGHDIWFMWGMGTGEHGTGRALDLMVRNVEAGNWIRQYLWDNRARFDLIHIIWWQSILSTRVSAGTIRPMADRGSTTANHRDHVHVLFGTGGYTPQATLSVADLAAQVLAGIWGNGDDRVARLRAAGYDPVAVQNEVNRLIGVGVPVTPPSASEPILRLGSTGELVRRLQSGLKRVFPAYAGRLSVDGDFGPNTKAAVAEFQRRSNLSADGEVGPDTRAELLKYDIDC